LNRHTNEIKTTKMKRIVRLFIVAVIVLGAQSSHGANPHPDVFIRVLDAQSFALYMKQIGNQKLEISIKDESGDILYNKRVRKQDSFKRKMNLKELPSGSYSLEIKDDLGTLSYPIALAREAVQIDAAKRVDRARGKLRKTDPDSAMRIWKSLVDGRWSMVDWFDSDQRRFVLAIRNPPGISDPHGLTKREAQVATYAALGESGKLIGYRLGLSTSRVSALLNDSMRKLRVRTQAELVIKLKALGATIPA
jgi:DNA-binding CsgD family transcriptional regulator